MRIPINLASEPRENLRPLRTAIVAAAVLAVLLAAIVIRRELSARAEFGSLIERQARVEQELRGLASDREQLESWLATPQALEIRERSAFLNSLILRKGLSWTQLFMDLEKTLPERAQITAIHPSLGAGEDVDLTLSVSASSLEPLVAFLKNLENSPQFGAPVVASQHHQNDKEPGGSVSLELTTRYVQNRAAPASEATPAAALRRSEAAEIALAQEALH